MKVSIIIPSYKDRGFLDEAILSAKNQTYKDTEIILVSDGNPNLIEFADKYGIRFILATKGNGSTAMNAGAKVATGEWLKFLSDDDTLPRGAIRDLFSAAYQCVDNYPAFVESDFAYGNGLNFKGETNKLRNSHSGVTVKEFLPPFENPIHGGAYMIRKEVFNKIGGFDENMMVGNDWDLIYRVFRGGYKTCCRDSVVYNFRIHSDQASAKESEADAIKYIKKKYDT